MMVCQEPATAPALRADGRWELGSRAPERVMVSQILGPSAGRRLKYPQVPVRFSEEEGGSKEAISTLAEEEAGAVEFQRTKLFADFDAKAKAAWRMEFEADAVAAQSECRFLQAEIHRLLAQRAAERVSTGKTIAELEATISQMQAEQEKERAQVHDARLNVEAATSQLLNGIDTKIGSLEADRSGLSEQVEHLEMEIHHIHEAHLEDIQAHRRWHAESIEQTLEAASPSAFMALVSFRAWRNLLQDQASVRQRRAMCHRATESFCGTSHVALKRAFIGAWRNALQQIQQQRRSQTILRRALQRCDALAPEVLRRSSFLAWKLLTFTPTKALAWETIQNARKRVADGPPRELLRSSFQWWMSRAEQARGQRDEELQRAELLKQLELQSHEASAAQVAHQELLAQRLADAAEQMKALEQTFQESQQHAEEVQQLQLAEEKQENTTLESKLSESEQRENDLRAEVARLADLLTAAECDSLEKASDFTNLQERYQESVAAQMELQRQEASVAGRLARVTQRVTEQDEEVDELRIALQAERAALLVLRREEVQSDLATTSSVRRSGASLPAMSPLQPRALDEVAKRWRLEHSHSVSAIYKSGTLPASLPVSGKLRGSGL